MWENCWILWSDFLTLRRLIIGRGPTIVICLSLFSLADRKYIGQYVEMKHFHFLSHLSFSSFDYNALQLYVVWVVDTAREVTYEIKIFYLCRSLQLANYIDRRLHYLHFTVALRYWLRATVCKQSYLILVRKKVGVYLDRCCDFHGNRTRESVLGCDLHGNGTRESVLDRVPQFRKTYFNGPV